MPECVGRTPKEADRLEGNAEMLMQSSFAVMLTSEDTRHPLATSTPSPQKRATLSTQIK